MGYFFVALTVVLTVAAQFLIKWQVNKAEALPADLYGKSQFMLALMLNPWILLGLSSAFVASLCWMLAMTKLPLSQAYPFMASAFVLVIFGGAWLFSEPVSSWKIAGTCLIAIGVLLIGLE